MSETETKTAPAPDPKAGAAAPAADAKVPKAVTKKSEPAEPRQVPALGEDRWQLKEHRNPGGWVCVSHGTELEDLMQPSFWANIARHMRPNTTVEVHWDDSSQFAEVYVLTSGRNWASVSLLRHVALAKPRLPQQAQQYGISFNGPVDKFRITRLADNAVIRAGFASEREARLFLDEYVRKLAA